MKKYQIHFYALKEIDEKLGNLLNYHAKNVIEEIVKLDWDEINKEPTDIVDEFYKEATKNRQVGIYVDEETHRRWKSMPRALKKQAQYLINVKLYLIATKKEKQEKPMSFLKRLIGIQ